MKKYSIGVIGYSKSNFDQDYASLLIEKGLEMLIRESHRSIDEIEIVSGLTYMGIPKLAYDWATTNNVRMVGIACSKAKNYICQNVDEEIIVGDEWGDESQIFLDRCDSLLKVGGGPQSEDELVRFHKTGKPVIAMSLSLKDG